ncbi:MAG: flagellar filament capping protein FliD [Helicobacteraceae bacterium]|jgi:flagellar hook-associated protein 2|nr:flagellar filament capping protein FliD [Helicobacteraceae bacterium]
MAVGTVSMLGLSLGGQSALNADLIDQLREADKSVAIKPYETQLEKTYKKQNDQAKLTEKLNAFRDAATVFSSDLSYLKRSASVSHDSISVSADSGAQIQSMSFKVTQLARNSVIQLNQAFQLENSMVNDGAPMTLQLVRKADQDAYDATKDSSGNTSATLKSLDINVKSGMTLSELRDAINEASDGKLTASILNVGGSDPYRLIIKSADTGAGEQLEFHWFDGSGTELNAGDSGHIDMTKTQMAQDAQFEYNGLSITRSSNTIKDLISGVTIELKKEDSIESNVSITRNLADLSEQMQAFADAYNDLMKLLGEITKYDADSGEAGSFQGDSRINSIRGDINKILFAENDNGENLMDLKRNSYNIDGTTSVAFAFSLSENGTLNFDSRTFEYALEQDPQSVERLLRGVTDVVGAQAMGSQVTSGADAAYNVGDLVINGVAIGAFSFDAADSSAKNAQTLLTAINAKTSETGASAKLGANGDSIILFNNTGDAISISGNKAVELGLPVGSFSGSTTTKNGIFSNLDSYADKLGGFWENATMTLIDRQLKSDVTSLTSSIQKTLDRLNAKYSIMTAQFASYNALISKYTSSFSAVQQMIDQAANSKS